MRIIAINGSPRKNKNTATLCKSFLEGASFAGDHIKTTLIHLYDLKYTGCISCFRCKKNSGGDYGRCCVVKDDLHDVFKKVSKADGLLFASPIYVGDMTGQMKCFLERLLFPFLTYEKDYRTIAPKRMPTAMLYTMNATGEMMQTAGYNKHLLPMEQMIGRIFLPPKKLYSYNTYQFKDYSKYRAEVFSEPEKAAYRKAQFPIDCQRAFLAGKQMAEVPVNDPV